MGLETAISILIALLVAFGVCLFLYWLITKFLSPPMQQPALIIVAVIVVVVVLLYIVKYAPPGIR